MYVTNCFSNAFIFGAITVAAGVIGLGTGALLTQLLRPKFPRIDPIICFAGLVTSSPILFASTFVVTRNALLCYVMLFFGQVTLNLNWAIIVDMSLVRSISLLTANISL